MGEIADMMLDGLLDEETGEYIGDVNEEVYGTENPGFPVSYERQRREAEGKDMTPTLMDQHEIEAFIDLVERMRQAQKDYFAYRERETLQLSKQLERQVDKTIESLKKPRLL